MKHDESCPPPSRSQLACVLAILTIAPVGAASDPAVDERARWSLTMGSLTVGAGDETATFTDLRSTCSAFRLTLGLGSAAAGIRHCLAAQESRRVRLALEDGAIAAATADPDDEAGRCVAQALGDARFSGLTCKLEATVSR
jgi:hypothetical protein